MTLSKPTRDRENVPSLPVFFYGFLFLLVIPLSQTVWFWSCGCDNSCFWYHLIVNVMAVQGHDRSKNNAVSIQTVVGTAIVIFWYFWLMHMGLSCLGRYTNHSKISANTVEKCQKFKTDTMFLISKVITSYWIIRTSSII